MSRRYHQWWNTLVFSPSPLHEYCFPRAVVSAPVLFVVGHMEGWYTPYLSKREAFTQCCFNVGPPSTTRTQHKTNIGSTPAIYRALVMLQYQAQLTIS